MLLFDYGVPSRISEMHSIGNAHRHVGVLLEGIRVA